MAKPTITDTATLIAAGIDPKTGLPIKATSGQQNQPQLKSLIRTNIELLDEQAAINRFTWYNLPPGLTGQLLERVLYYKGQGALIFIEELKKFYFLPFALDGTIDVYGRFLGIRPLPFNGASQDIPEGQKHLKAWLNSQVKTPVYDIILPEELKYEDLTKSAVILKDYSESISQTIVPRAELHRGIIDIESDCIPFMRTALLNATGVNGMRVGGEDEQSNVQAASDGVYSAALSGKKWIPMVGQVDFQDLGASNVGRAEEFLLAMQSLDNFRLGLFGLDNGGLFQKKAHMLQDEQNMNGGTTGLIMQDGLTNRQRFCNIVNSIWGLGVWVDISENVNGLDLNMDGQVQDDQDQSGAANNAPEGGAQDE